MNNIELQKKVIGASRKLLYEKGYIAPVDVLLQLEIVDKKKYLDWRNGRVPYLEKVCNKNLSKMSLILKTIADLGRKDNLKPSFTYYKQYGSKNKLRFSRSNNEYIENKYATHYVNTNFKKQDNIQNNDI